MATRTAGGVAELRAAARLLGVASGAGVEDVVAARRAQAKLWHPDVNPSSGSAVRMGLINRACDLLCEHLRRGGYIEGVQPRTTRMPRPVAPRVQQRVFEISFEGGVGVPISAPDRLARLEIDETDALAGGTRTVRFVRREPGRCPACAGLGAVPSGPKRVCPDCGGEAHVTCPGCEGRGWVHLNPGSCPRCQGTGAGLVERSVRLKLPAGIREVRRALVLGWGDLAEDGSSGNLWVDLVPSPTAMRSSTWHFSYFGHDWPRPAGRVHGDWLSVVNDPLPDDEMRELGFWRDPDSEAWVRQTPVEGADVILDLIRQRQFFVPRQAV
jgi:DnaJ-class molecular chaperone